jgi:hypothetical protein
MRDKVAEVSVNQGKIVTVTSPKGASSERLVKATSGNRESGYRNSVWANRIELELW